MKTIYVVVLNIEYECAGTALKAFTDKDAAQTYAKNWKSMMVGEYVTVQECELRE